MSQAVATIDRAKSLADRVREDDFLAQVQAALPEHVSPRRFTRAAATLMLTSPEIAEADPQSILLSLLRCAQDGLMPDGREAAIVPFYDKKTRTKRATYIPMIGGIRAKLADHGWSLRTAVVHENDEFEFEEGLAPRLSHRRPRPGVDRGQKVAAYAVAVHRDHPEPLIAVMYADEIEKVRRTSKQPDGELWTNWPERAWEKTIGHYLARRVPLGERVSERVLRVIDADALPDGEAAGMLYGPHGAARALPAPEPAREPDVVEVNPGGAAAPGDDGRAGADGAPAPVSNSGAAGQATDAPTRGESPASAAPAAAPPPTDQPEPEPEPVLEPSGQATFEPPADAQAAIAQLKKDADAAGHIRFGSGSHTGKTIAELHVEHGDEAETYLRYAARSMMTSGRTNPETGEERKPEPDTNVRAAARAYLAYYFPGDDTDGAS